MRLRRRRAQRSAKGGAMRVTLALAWRRLRAEARPIRQVHRFIVPFSPGGSADIRADRLKAKVVSRWSSKPSGRGARRSAGAPWRT
jgi:tripartite-type tricarboxylate transporter receptor subunit TctC